MDRENIAIVGLTDAILPFGTFGIRCEKLNRISDAGEKVKLLARQYSIIMIEEEVALEIDYLITRYKTQPYPIILVLPSTDLENGYAMKEINKNIEKAIGTSIKLN